MLLQPDNGGQGLTDGTGLDNGIVCQVFQVMTHFAFQKPRKGIHPTYDGNQLANHHIYRMPLENMGTFVCKYLIYFFLRMAFRMYEDHFEE